MKKDKKINKKEHLKEKERFLIEKMRSGGYTNEQIAKVLGRGTSTISAEIRKFSTKGTYDHKKAHHKAYLKQYCKKRTCLKVAMDTGIRQWTEYYLFIKRWSPETVSATLWLRHRLKVSAKAVYKYIKNRCLEYLLTNHKKRKRSKRINSELTDRILITDPQCTREGYGHWEGDFIVSPSRTKDKHVLLVLTERITRETKIELLPNRNNDLVNETVVSMLSDRTVQSITLDNDIAFIKHKTLSLMLAAPVYFTRPYRSTDKALVENTNRWIRKFVPKGTNLRTVTSLDIIKSLDWLNERPRKCLGWMTAGLCAKQQEELLNFS